MKSLIVSLFCLLSLTTFAEDSPVPGDEHFKVDTLAFGLSDAMEIAVASDGRVFIVERTGAVKLYDPRTEKLTEVAKIDVTVRKGSYARECGLLGITLDPHFDKNGWLYLYYSAPGNKPVQRLSRFTYKMGKLGDEKIVLTIDNQREHAVCHEGGSLTFGPKGNLYLSVGDNTCPFQSDGYAPLDERKGHLEFDSQRSAGNTNDLRGKIIRIKPTPNGGYAIPEGNLFEPGTPNTRPEIFAMGCRNPFRMSVDQKTGFVYWGEVGPDSGQTSQRGSSGFDEVNQARKAGNFGWPYFVADNKPYGDYDFDSGKIGEPFNPEGPVNDSPNNTGLKNLPPATKPLWFYPRASACAGPVYYFDEQLDSKAKLPKELDQCLIIYDWTSAWIRLVKLDENGDIEWNHPWLSRYLWIHPVDIEMGPKGEMYVLEYGTPWYDGSDGRLKKVSYSKDPVNITVAASDPRMEGLPENHPGFKLIAGATCLACHTTKVKSYGPNYTDVSRKYAAEDGALEKLTKKVHEGGAGVWGEIPMPPHPQYSEEDIRQMVDAILRMDK